MRVCKLMCMRASTPRVCVHLNAVCMCVLCVYAGANCQENDSETTCTGHERASKCDTEVRTTRTHTHAQAHTRALHSILSSLLLSLALLLSLLFFFLSLFSLSVLSLSSLCLSRSLVCTHARARAHTHTQIRTRIGSAHKCRTCQDGQDSRHQAATYQEANNKAGRAGKRPNSPVSERRACIESKRHDDQEAGTLHIQYTKCLLSSM